MNPYEISCLGSTEDAALIAQVKLRLSQNFAQSASNLTLDEQVWFKQTPVDATTLQDNEILRLRRTVTGSGSDEKIAWTLHSLQRPTPTRDLPQALSRIAISVPLLFPQKDDIHGDAAELLSALGYRQGPTFRRKGFQYCKDTATVLVYQIYGVTDSPLHEKWLIEAINYVSMPSVNPQQQMGAKPSSQSASHLMTMSQGLAVIEEIKQLLKGLRMSSGLISAREYNVPVNQIFSRQDIVGKGAYGAVYRGALERVHNATGTIVALKIIELDTPDEDITEIQREVAVLSQLREAEKNNCTSYHGCWLYKTQLWLAMDYAAGGSIRTIMKSCSLEEKFIAIIMRESLVALAYLHKQGIIHRDIKAANILLTSSGRIIVCDFGVAAHLQGQNKRATFSIALQTGTPYWMAPEVIVDGKLYDTKADIWSLGVTLYECATGNPPFAQYEALRAIQLIPKNPPSKLDPNQPWSPMMREFLAFCLTEEPSERMSAEDLQRTKWIKANAKWPVTLLRELIMRYSNWVNGGGIRNSIINVEDSPSTDDSREFGSESSWDYSPMPPSSSQMTYTGSNLGTDLGHSLSTSAAPVPARKNPLAYVFEEEGTTNSGPVINATAAAKAYGLGLNVSSTTTAKPTHEKPQISIPNFGDDSDNEDAAMTLKINRTRRPPEGLHLKAPSHSTTKSPPSPRSTSPPFRRRPSSPPPPSPSLITPTAFKFGTGSTAASTTREDPQLTPVSSSPSLPSMALKSGSPPHVTPHHRMRANTAPSHEHQMNGQIGPLATVLPNGSLTASPPSTRPLIRRGRSGTATSSESAHPNPSAHGRKLSANLASQPNGLTIAMPPPLMTESTLLSLWQEGPAIKSFNYPSLISVEDVHAELERTVNELDFWLHTLDAGLSGILSFVPSNPV